jgi:hypothetical protein
MMPARHFEARSEQRQDIPSALSNGKGHIFQPFHRLHDRTSHDGSGLGPAIVAIHGATIDARRNPGGGLVVDITFPPPGQPLRRSPDPAPNMACIAFSVVRCSPLEPAVPQTGM